MKKYDQAIADCEKAIAIDPKYAYARGFLAEIYGEQGKHKRFYETLETALKLGYPVRKFLRLPSYNSYRNKERFQNLLQRYEKNND